MARRGANQGSIRAVSTNKWRLRKDYYTPDGRRKWIDETISGSKKQAEARMSEIKDMLKIGIVPSGNTLNEFLNQWLSITKQNVKPKTHYDYQNILKYARKKLGHVTLQDLRGDHIQSLYSAMLDEGLSTRTVKLLHVVLGSALKAAVKWGHLSYSPTERATAPKQRRKEIKAWSREEVKVFLKGISEHKHQNVYKLLLYTGIRRAEVCGLTWSDVDLDGKTLTIRRNLQRIVGEGLTEGTPKTNKSFRKIALASAAVDTFRKQRSTQSETRLSAGSAWNDTNKVFTNDFGNPIDPDKLTTEFKSLVENTTLTKITLHGLRHTFASLSIMAKVDAKIMSESLGHSSVSFTLDTYGHLFPSQKQEAADAFDMFLKTG